MEFRLLGPLELWAHGSRQHLGASKERHLLAVLLCADRAPVPADTLLRRVWDDPPASGTATLQSNLSRLRARLRAVGGDRVRLDFSAGSYSLDVPAGAVDIQQFRDMRRRAHEAASVGDVERAAALLTKAESLWRAEPLAEFPGGWAAAVRRRLTEDLRQTREQRITWELQLGRHADLVPELSDLLTRERDPESYALHLMLALQRSGRHGDALAVYQETRLRLRQTLGADPSPELERLHQRILTRDPTLHLARTAPQRAVSPGPPDTLPRDISDFSGRQHELAALLSAPGPGMTALPVTVIHGMGGVGKTSLITHVAHRLRERYPDGCLHIHLRGHNEQPPVEPSEALALLLRAVGITPNELPTSLDARATLWRERTAHRSVLLFLDDAHDAAQVRPLLPGSPKCRVFVTSRHGLANLEGTQSVGLDVLDTAEAVRMFTRIAGVHRTTDQSAVRQVVNICNRYPLAIRLAANQLRHRDTWDAHDLAERLIHSSSPLEEIDVQPGIAAVFDLTYAGLREQDQRLFRALALHPGPDLTVGVITVIADASLVQVRKSVDELVDTHLLEEPVKDRYRLHDVVRDIARTAGELHDPPGERRDTVRRVLDHYLSAADRCDRLAHPQRRRIEVPVSDPTPHLPDVDSADMALAWLDLNRSNLLAAARLAAVEHFGHAVYFPHVLDRAFHLWGMWETATGLNAAGLARARERGEQAVAARLLVERAAVLRPQGAHEEALRHATEALSRGRAAGDVWLQGEALEQIGIVDLVSGRLPDALKRFQEALPLHRATGNHDGEAEALSHQGIVWGDLGHYQQALRQFRAALKMHQRSGNSNGQTKTLNNIGEVYRKRGDQEAARVYYERSLALVRKFGGRQELAILYNNLGSTCLAAGSTAQAQIYFGMALETYRAIGDRAGQADSLVNLGFSYRDQGRYAEASTYVARADAVAREIDDQQQQQRIRAADADFRHRLGQHGEALSLYREALQLARDMDLRYEEAQALQNIAKITEDGGDGRGAAPFWREAQEIYEGLGFTQQAHSIQQHLDAARDGTR